VRRSAVGLVELVTTNTQRSDVIDDSRPVVRVVERGIERPTTQTTDDGVSDDARPQSAPLCGVYPVTDVLGHGHTPILHSRGPMPLITISPADRRTAVQAAPAAARVLGDVEDRVRRSRVWDAPKGGVIDHLDVMAYIRRIADEYTLTECAYDPRFFEVPALTLTDEGLNMVEFSQSPERMGPACAQALELIVLGKVAHDGDPVLTAHVSAAVKRENDRGWTLSKGRSKRKIDACIAMVIALSRATAADQSGPTLW
jgi:Phage Terminase